MFRKNTFKITLTALTAVMSINMTAMTAEAKAGFGSLEDIKAACSTKAVCETDFDECIIDTENDENPYDVEYDYGEAYEKYVDACDWDLVFDAEYYKKTFPMLAIQYHDDDELLLRHFQTVGIHEGRQGSADFNWGAYYLNCSDKVYKAFGKTRAAYYIYYMLNYNTEKSVNTKTADNGKETYEQYDVVMTALQKNELIGVNKIRKENGAENVKFDSEIAAYANFRAWMNTAGGYEHHDWAIERVEDGTINNYVGKYCIDGKINFAENTNYGSLRNNPFDSYKDSKEHFDAMVNPKAGYIGCSNRYVATTGAKKVHFDVYANKGTIDTPTHAAE